MNSMALAARSMSRLVLASNLSKSAAPIEFAVFEDETTEEPFSAVPAKQATNRQAFERKALGNYKPKAPVVLLKDFAREQGTTRNVVGGYLKVS